MPDEIVEEETHPSSVQFEGRKVELHGVSKTGPLGIALLAFLLRLLGPLLNVFIKRTKKILPRQGNDSEGVFHLLDILFQEMAFELQPAHPLDLHHRRVTGAKTGLSVADKVLQHFLE